MNSKEYIQDYEDRIANLLTQVEEGNESPLNAWVAFRQLQVLAGIASNQLLNEALDEVRQYPEKRISILGAKVEERKTATTYDFTADDIYRDLDQKIKDRRKRLKHAAMSADLIIDTETGQEMTVVPVKKEGSYTLAFTPKKA